MALTSTGWPLEPASRRVRAHAGGRAGVRASCEQRGSEALRVAGARGGRRPPATLRSIPATAAAPAQHQHHHCASRQAAHALLCPAPASHPCLAPTRAPRRPSASWPRAAQRSASGRWGSWDPWRWRSTAGRNGKEGGGAAARGPHHKATAVQLRYSYCREAGRLEPGRRAGECVCACMRWRRLLLLLLLLTPTWS